MGLNLATWEESLKYVFSEAAFRRKACVTLDWKGSMPSLLIYNVLV